MSLQPKTIPRRWCHRTPVVVIPDILRNQPRRKSNRGRPRLVDRRHTLSLLEQVFVKWCMRGIGLTQRQLSRHIGAPQAAVNKWLRGVESPPSRHLIMRGLELGYLAASYQNKKNARPLDVILDGMRWIQHLVAQCSSEKTRLFRVDKCGVQIEIPYEVDLQLDKVSVVFNLKPDMGLAFRDRVHGQSGKSWSSDSFDLSPYCHHKLVADFCRVDWMPISRSSMRWAKIELHGKSLENGWAQAMFQLLVTPFADPSSLALTRLDVAVDYLSATPLSALVLAHDSALRKMEILEPECLYLRCVAANQVWGSSRRMIRLYNKTVERLDRSYLDDNCIGCHNQVYQVVQCTDCAQTQHPTHVMRCEVQLRPGSKEERYPGSYLLDCQNPFATFQLVHLGMVRDWLALALLTAGRMVGLTKVRQELEGLLKSKRHRKTLRKQFGRLVAQAAQDSAPVLQQPHGLFDVNRAALQAALNSVVGVPR